jgi:hypothetical protein
MDEYLDDIEKDLIAKYHLTAKSSNQEILKAAQKEYPETMSGSVAASVRHYLREGTRA